MAELDRRYGQSVDRADTGVIDQGLRAYMIRVYNYMASGVTITGVVAYAIYTMAVQLAFKLGRDASQPRHLRKVTRTR